MEEKKLLSTKLHEDIYKVSRIPLKKAPLIISLIFITAFMSSFPLKKIIKSFIVEQITMLRSCPISYKDIEVSFILPKVTLLRPLISGVCFNRPGTLLGLQDLPISLSLPSFLPPGLRLNIKMQKGKTRLNIYPTLSFATHQIRVKDSVVDSDILANFMGGKKILKGTLSINALATIRKNKLSKGDLLITSKKLTLPAQDFGFFQLAKTIELGALQIKMQLKSSTNLKLVETFIGGVDSPFAIKVNGKVTLNQNNPESSALKLTGGVKFSKQFLEDYAIISLFLNLDGKKTDEEGFFPLQIEGTLGAPTPKIL